MVSMGRFSAWRQVVDHLTGNLLTNSRARTAVRRLIKQGDDDVCRAATEHQTWLQRSWRLNTSRAPGRRPYSTSRLTV